MLYIKFENGKAVSATAEHQRETCYQSRWDWKSFAQVDKIAEELTAAAVKQHPRKLYLPTDAGPSTAPRYDVIEAPEIGDKVSKAFNGDSYPVGTIVAISASYRRVQTSDGITFWRRGRTAAWIANGTWSMQRGHVSTRNPSF